MTVVTLVTTAAPPSLRGELTRWFLEIAPGVYVGQVSNRVRERVWDLVGDHLDQGRAIISYTNDSEQGFGFEVIGHDRQPTGHDGLTLITQPHRGGKRDRSGGRRPPPESWGTTSRRRRYAGKRSWR